jgi:hypothetical protein
MGLLDDVAAMYAPGGMQLSARKAASKATADEIARLTAERQPNAGFQNLAAIAQAQNKPGADLNQTGLLPAQVQGQTLDWLPPEIKQRLEQLQASQSQSSPGVMSQPAYDTAMGRINKESQNLFKLQEEGIGALQKRIAELSKTPEKNDGLQKAIIAAADLWGGGGGTFNQMYQQAHPEMTAAQRQAAITQLEDTLRKSKEGLSQDKLNLLKLQLENQTENAKLAAKGAAAPDLKQNQWDAAKFGQQMMLAEKDLADVLGQGYDATGKTEGFMRSVMPGFAQGPQTKQFESAKETFLTALLRDQSGATIGSKEYSRQEKAMFPQAGDDDKTLKEKARRRAQAIKSMMAEAGAAWGQSAIGGGASAPQAQVDPALLAEIQRRGLKL